MGEPVVRPAPYQDAIVVACSTDDLYALVSDVTRTGEWSPICRECRWDDGAGPEVGAWFTGRNEVPGRTWETRSQVVVAEPGREFAWQVGGSLVRWGYVLRPLDALPGYGARTELVEQWEFLPDGIALFVERYGDDAAAQVAERTQAARVGIPATLDAIRRIAEAEAGTGSP